MLPTKAKATTCLTCLHQPAMMGLLPSLPHPSNKSWPDHPRALPGLANRPEEGPWREGKGFDDSDHQVYSHGRNENLPKVPKQPFATPQQPCLAMLKEWSTIGPFRTRTTAAKHGPTSRRLRSSTGVTLRTPGPTSTRCSASVNRPATWTIWTPLLLSGQGNPAPTR